MAKAPAKAAPKPVPQPEPEPVEEEVQEEGTVDFGGDEEGGALVVNMNDVDEQGKFVAIPRGMYDCTVTGLNFEHSQSKGNPMWTWELEVMAEYHPDQASRKLFYHTTFNEGGLPRVKRALARIRCENGVNLQLLQTSFNPEKVALEGYLLGARCKVRVDVRPYEGQLRNNVRDILPPSEEGGFIQAAG